MKGAMNDAGAMRGVEAMSNSADARDQIIDRRRPEVAECGFKRNTARFG